MSLNSEQVEAVRKRKLEELEAELEVAVDDATPTAMIVSGDLLPIADNNGGFALQNDWGEEQEASAVKAAEQAEGAVRKRKLEECEAAVGDEVLGAIADEAELKEFKKKFMSFLERDIKFIEKVIFEPSNEQYDCLFQLSRGKYVITSAVAGAGKTTVVLYYAKWLEWTKQDIRICHVTYTSELKKSNRQSAKQWGVREKMFECHSFHSLVKWIYWRNGHPKKMPTDVDMAVVVEKEVPPNHEANYTSFQLLSFDELQDVNHLLFSFIAKFILDIKKKTEKAPQIIALGEEWQSIFEWQGGDSRFLTMGDKAFELLVGGHISWTRIKFSLTYRCSPEIADFVSRVMMKQPGYMVSARTNELPKEPVRYVTGQGFLVAKRIYKEIKDVMRKGYNAEDIFILVNSLKFTNNTPLGCLHNLLVKSHIPCFLSEQLSSDGINNFKDDSDVREGKICISTFHGSKGREKKVVVVMNFNNGYWSYEKSPSNTKTDRTVCPKVYLVAATRASHILILAGGESEEKNETFDFLDCVELEKMTDEGSVRKVMVDRYNTRTFNMQAGQADQSDPNPSPTPTPTPELPLSLSSVVQPSEQSCASISISSAARFLPWSIIAEATRVIDEAKFDVLIPFPTTHASRGTYGKARLELDQADLTAEPNGNGEQNGNANIVENGPATPEHLSKRSTITITEVVASFIGTAITALVEYDTTNCGFCFIDRQIKHHFEDKDEGKSLAKIVYEKLRRPIVFVDFIHLAILEESLSSGLTTTPLRQLAKELHVSDIPESSQKKRPIVNPKDSDPYEPLGQLGAEKWLQPEYLNDMKGNIINSLGTNVKDALWEVSLSLAFQIGSSGKCSILTQYEFREWKKSTPTKDNCVKTFELCGRVDVWTADNEVVEIKCSEGTLTLEHKIQLVMYAFLINHIKDGLTTIHDYPGTSHQEKIAKLLSKGDPKFKLLSANTSESHIFSYSTELEALVMKILPYLEKNSHVNSDDDVAFINSAHEACKNPSLFVKKMKELGRV